MRIARRELQEDGSYFVQVVEVAVRDVVFEGERFVLRKTQDTVDSLRCRGKVTSMKRLERLAERHDAVILEDVGVMETALRAEDEASRPSRTTPTRDGPEPLRQEDVYSDVVDEDLPPEPDREQDDDDLTVELLLLGLDADTIAGMSTSEKRRRLDEESTPAPPEPKPGRRKKKRRKKKRRKPKTSAPPSEYHLVVWRSEWPEHTTPEGDRVRRVYDCGTTASEVTARRTEANWSEAGFETDLRPGKRQKQIRRLDNELAGEPFEPLLCGVPDCPWVGINLGSHLKTHGMNFAEYAEAFNYNGPKMASRGHAALKKAHAATCRKHDVRVGMFFVEVRGDADVDVWRLTKVENANSYKLAWIVGTKEEKNLVTMTAQEFFDRLKPVGTFAKTLRKKKLKEARRG